MKRVKVIVQAKLAVEYWELIPMESGAELSALRDTDTVRVAEERQSGNKKRNHWWLEANWPRLKEALVNSRYPSLRGQCDETCLELGLDPVPKQTVFNVLRRIGRKPIAYENIFHVKKISLISDSQVKYGEDLVIKSDAENLRMSRKEVIQVISELDQAKSFVQAENHLH